MSKTTIRFTAEDYRALPPSAPRVELIDGEFIMTPAPSTRHQIVLGNLHGIIWNHLKTRPGLGRVLGPPCDVFLSDEDVVQPDLLLVIPRHADRIRTDGVHGPPDLVVEVLSPSNAIQDLTVKREIYRRSGVDEYWVVDPKGETVTVYRLQEAAEPQSHERGATLESRVLPGLRLDLSEVFSG